MWPSRYWLQRVGRTPFYVYDRGVMTRKVQELRAALPDGIEIHYAMKANPMPAVVQPSTTQSLVSALE